MRDMHFTIDNEVYRNQKEWDQYVQSSNNGTIFHERRFLSYHPPSRFLDHSLIFKSKKKIIALLPAIEKKNNNKKYFISHGGASFGGFVYEDISIRNAFYLVDDFINYAHGKNFNHVIITLPPFTYYQHYNNHLEFALIQSGFRYLKRELTSIVSLNYPVDKITRLYKPEARTAINKAQKMGVEVRISSDYDSYFAILENNLIKHNNISPTHSVKEIKKLAKMYPDKIFLFAAFLDDKMIAGIVNFICNQRVVLTFYICDDNSYRQYRPVNLLMYEVMKWAAEKQINYIDLGTVTVNMVINWGLGKFKETLGARGMFRDTFEIIL
jgi:hypothetical protein